MLLGNGDKRHESLIAGWLEYAPARDAGKSFS